MASDIGLRKKEEKGGDKVYNRLPNKWFWITLLIPVVLLLSMTIQPLKVSLFADEIMIKTKPYDPKDLFYGDYVTLHYEIEDVPKSLIDDEIVKEAQDGSRYAITVYVELEKKGDVYEAKRVVANEPKEGIYLKGKLYPYNLDVNSDDVVHIDYKNINRFYVEENTGYDLEEKARKGQLHAILKVYKGNAVLKDIR